MDKKNKRAGPSKAQSHQTKATVNSQRKKTQKKFQKDLAVTQSACDNYADLYNRLPIGFFFLNQKEEIEKVNDLAAQWLGDEVKNLLQQRLDQFIHPRFHTHFQELLNPPLTTAHKTYTDLLLISTEKIQTWVAMSASPCPKAGGYTLLAMDITQNKKMEGALQNIEDQLQHIISTTREGIWVIDAETRTTYVNQTMASMLGYTVDEMINKTIFDFMDEEGQRIALEKIERRRQGVQEQHDFIFCRKDSSAVWTILETNPILDDQGNYNGAFAMVMDISDRIRGEEALRQSETRYRQLVESAPDIVYTYAQYRGGIYYSPRVQSVLGYTPEYLYAHPTLWIDAIHPEDRAQITTLLNNFEQQQPFDLQYRVRNAGGNWVWLRNRSMLYHTRGNELLLEGLASDITTERQSRYLLDARMRLAEFSLNHTLTELLRATLDETERLTDSSIGFFHFMEEDQNTISLQSWSTRTLKEFCHATGAGQHYPLSQAGVWADCVRCLDPVIYNDYASVPFQKGMPPGHANVTRLLTMPIMRGGQVVAIFGVGNKPIDYHQKDIQSISLLADLAWDIAERKMAEEKVIAANKKLEEQLNKNEILQGYLREQATRDALTGLFNRHYLHETIDRELSRAKRMNHSICIMMIDIDHFKKFNDTYGHQAGDEVLLSLGRLLSTMTRQGEDVACRYGGEEFIIIMPGVDEQEADMRANTIRYAFANLPVEYEGKEFFATISVGLGFYPKHGTNMPAIIQAADNALYQAKQAGRNCVRHWQSA